MNKITKQARAELCQAQVKLEVSYSFFKLYLKGGVEVLFKFY